jgi:hypothetical protein
MMIPTRATQLPMQVAFCNKAPFTSGRQARVSSEGEPGLAACEVFGVLDTCLHDEAEKME